MVKDSSLQLKRAEISHSAWLPSGSVRTVSKDPLKTMAPIMSIDGSLVQTHPHPYMLGKGGFGSLHDTLLCCMTPGRMEASTYDQQRRERCLCATMVYL
jgi:hypothetical protein